LAESNKAEYAGRSNDERPWEERVKDTAKEINLEYRNKDGKLMTRKEAFRYICWNFHGKGPSKGKIDKMKKRELINE